LKGKGEEGKEKGNLDFNGEPQPEILEVWASYCHIHTKAYCLEFTLNAKEVRVVVEV